MKQLEIVIRIAGQSAEMPVQAQAKAYLARAWRRREAKGVTPMRESAYRLRWTIWAMALLGASGNLQSATLSATVLPRVQGIVGQTGLVTAAISGSMDVSIQSDTKGIPSITLIPNGFHCADTRSARVGQGSTGVYGFLLDGPTSGAVLLADGSGSWTRRFLTNSGQPNRYVRGSYVLTAGTWNVRWNTDSGGSYSGENQSRSDGTYGSGGINTVSCPVPTSGSNIWYRPNGSKQSSLSVRFLIDAPVGGLAPGRYTSPTLYVEDMDQSSGGTGKGSETVALGDVLVTVPDYGCTINAPPTISLDNGARDGATVYVTSVCDSRPLSSTTAPTAVSSLTLIASGLSAGVSANPLTLGVPNSDGSVFIRGNWSNIVPTCTDSNVYFDGRVGVQLGPVSPGQKVDYGVMPVSFRLCTTPDAKPGQYTAQATISIVQR